MKQRTETETEAGSDARKRDRHISPDGCWRAFPQVPGLLQYIPTGTFFGRVKVKGKQIRRSLKTESFSLAKIKLGDFRKRHARARKCLDSFAQAREQYGRDLTADYSISDRTKAYYRECIVAMMQAWPKLDERKLASITETDCREWAKRFSDGHAPIYFNNTLSVLRKIIEAGGIDPADNPARKIKRLGIARRNLELPTLAKFNELVLEIATAGARQSKDCADFVRFLAFSGCRLSEAAAVRWSDVDLDAGKMKVQSAKTRTKRHENENIRMVPIIPPMRELLASVKEKHNPKPEDFVCRVNECENSLTHACERVGIKRLTHHDLRHLFATRCIESGVDIPTVSRWLGHSDGGALAMKTYGHLRDEHSTAMAQRVSFTDNEKTAQ